jgi:hypothetical protein
MKLNAEVKILNTFQLLSTKPIVYLVDMTEDLLIPLSNDICTVTHRLRSFEEASRSDVNNIQMMLLFFGKFSFDQQGFSF